MLSPNKRTTALKEGGSATLQEASHFQVTDIYTEDSQLNLD